MPNYQSSGNRTPLRLALAAGLTLNAASALADSYSRFSQETCVPTSRQIEPVTIVESGSPHPLERKVAALIDSPFRKKLYWSDYSGAVQAGQPAINEILESGFGYLKDCLDNDHQSALAVFVNDLGIAFQNLGHTSTAIEYYLSGLRIKPTDASLHHNLGFSLYVLAQNRIEKRDFLGALNALDRSTKHFETSIALESDPSQQIATFQYVERLKLMKRQIDTHGV